MSSASTEDKRTGARTAQQAATIALPLGRLLELPAVGTWPDMWRASFVLIKYGFVVTRQGEIGPGQPGRGEDLALDEHVSREQAATWTCVHVLRKDSGQAEELSFRPGGETQVEPHVEWWVTRDREGGRGLTHSLPEEHTHTHSHYLRSAQLGGYRSLSPYNDWGWGWVLLFPC